LQRGDGSMPAGPQLPADAQMVDLNKIEYTQPGISFSTKNRDTGESQSVGMAAQMMKTGWDVSQPADIVKLSDGRLVSLDHRRLWAADRAGLKQVSARVHAETQALDAATAKRFAIEGKGVPTGTNPVTNQPWKAGDRPKTWGDAIRFRSAVQGFGKAGQQGKIGYNPGVLPGGAGVRDPNFPATGSKDMPMRVQPGPFNRDEPYTGGGTVMKGGGKRTTVPSGRRLGFAQIGGFDVKRRSYPANLGEKAQKWAVGLRFHVLRPPSKVSYRGVRGGTETESLTLADRDVVDGKVRAIVIDGTPIVPVMAADQQTAAFFRADAALGLDHSGVVKETNIDDIRWLRPEQIEMVDGPGRRFMDHIKEHPDWRKDLGFPKGNDLGDPDSLQWDRIKGQWVQKRKG